MGYEYIAEARKKKNLTQTKAASLIGMHQASYSNIESGKRKPSVDAAKKIASVLDVDWKLFFK